MKGWKRENKGKKGVCVCVCVLVGFRELCVMGEVYAIVYAYWCGFVCFCNRT